MIVLALPVLDLRTWPQDPSTQSTDLTTRKAYDLICRGVRARPERPDPDRGRPRPGHRPGDGRLARELEARDDIAEVSKPIVSPDGALTLFNAVPAFSPTDEGATDAVASIRDQVPDGVEVTGQIPLFADIADLLRSGSGWSSASSWRSRCCCWRWCSGP